MKVKDLIAQLNKLDPEEDVYIAAYKDKHPMPEDIGTVQEITEVLPNTYGKNLLQMGAFVDVVPISLWYEQ